MLVVYGAKHQPVGGVLRALGLATQPCMRYTFVYTFFFISLCILQIFVLLDEQRATLKTEVDPSLIEQNKEEFIRLQHTIFC